MGGTPDRFSSTVRVQRLNEVAVALASLTGRTPRLSTVLGTDAPEYEGITTVMTIKSVCRFLPLLTVPLLVPRGTPADTAEAMGAVKSAISGGQSADASNVEIAAIVRQTTVNMDLAEYVEPARNVQ